MPFPGTSTLPLIFSGGLNSAVAEYSLDQPNLQTAENAVTAEFGQLDKRTGFVAQPRAIMGGGQISNGEKITTFNNGGGTDELILLDGATIYSYQEEEQVWINRGLVFDTVCTQQKVLNTKIATQSNPNVSSSNNISVYAWEDNRTLPIQSSGVRYSVINQLTNTFIISDNLVFPNSTRPTVISDGYHFYLFYCASSFDVLYNVIPVAAPNTVTQQLISLTSNGYSSTFGEASIAYDAMIYIPRSPADAPGVLLTVVATQSGLIMHSSLTGTVTVDSNTFINCVSICTDQNHNIWITYSDNSAVYCTAYNLNILTDMYVQLFAPITVVTSPAVNLGCCGDRNRGSLNLTCEFVNDPLNNYCNNYIITSKGIHTLIGQIRSVGLASKPFLQDGNVFINTINASVLQATYFTQCLSLGIGFIPGTSTLQAINNSTIQTDFTIVAKHSATNGGVYRTNNILSQCSLVAPDTYLFAGQRKGPFISYESSQASILGVAGYTIGFNNANPFQNVSSNNNLHIVGGVKKIYDGISCVEDNFHLFPELPDGFGCDLSIFTGGGGLSYNPETPDAQYQWIVVYEWTDNYQQVQRSGTSVANSYISTATGQGAILTVPTLRLTDKVSPRSPVSISIYRTLYDGTIFYKITNDSDPLVNDTTVDTLTFTDNLTDADIQQNEILYTSEQLANTAPPSCSLISLYQQRLMINQTEDPKVLWYSQNKFDLSQYNTLALDWNTSFVEGVDSRFGSDITAIGLLDNNLAIFKETSIFLLSGDGPNPLFTAGQFNDAQPLVSDTGCTNPDSLVFLTQTPKTPGGLMFQSKKGIYLLGRDQSLYFIGAPVKKYNYLTINGANILANSNQVVFTSDEGICLVYNYYFDCWSTWTNLPCVSSTVWNDQLVLLTKNGGAMIQDITNTVYQDTYPNDNQSNPQLKIVSPWVKFNGQGNLQGRAVVYNCVLLGQLKEPHNLQIDIAYDYDPAIRETQIISSTVAANRWGNLPIWGNDGQWGGSQFSNYQFMINFKYPRGFYGGGCQSVQLTITDLDPDPSAGYSLNALVFEFMPLPGNYLVPTGNLSGG